MRRAVCPECDADHGLCTTCLGRGYIYIEPPRETFDPEAVRALLDELRAMPPNTTAARLAQRVRDSQTK